VINEYPEERLHKILGMYGEVKNARTAASAIVRARTRGKIESSVDLVAVLKPIAPRGKEFKYYAQVFQALRIEVNKEMEALEAFLMQCAEVMDKGSRLVVMSYHSLEDRMVKNYINTGKVYGDLEKDFYGNPLRPFKAINKKPITANEDELEQNKRARSAKLRIAERL
jgi:16S rRNA (cytosine1402-N4)-methyltransferase